MCLMLLKVTLLFFNKISKFLEKKSLGVKENLLVVRPTNSKYLCALDLYPCSFLMFDNSPIATLKNAKRFITKQTATHG